jgi:hypothetical protein
MMSSLSSYWTGRQLDRAGWSPRTLAFSLGLMFCVPGALWLWIQSRWQEQPPETLGSQVSTLAADRTDLRVES